MIPILYDSNETSFTSNGIGRLRDCISAIVTEERNGIYELDFTYPIDGANFDKIQCGRVVAVRHDDSNDIQPFDIVSYSKPINGVVTFHAVHISYRQRGLVAYGTNINTLADALTLLKDNATPTNPFTYEADFTSTAYFGAGDGTPRSVRTMLGGVEGSILDSYGGEFEWDKFRVILHRRRGVDRDFSIRYGVNLLDYNEDTDYQQTFNSAIPYWTGSDGVKDIIVVGKKATSSMPTFSGREICASLDLTEKFQTKPTKAQLTTEALSILNNKQTTLPQQTIKVDFVRLQDLGEYENLQSLLQCNLCDTIEVIFPRYNMRGRFKIVKTVFDVIRGKYVGMELGDLSTTLAQALGITEGGTKKPEADLIYVNADDDVEVNANMVINGSLTVQGHSSPIGTIIEEQTSASTSVPSGTSTPLMSITLPDGVWVVRVLIRFPAMGTDRTKVVQANISSTSGATAYMYRQPCENLITEVMLTQIITAGGTYYTNVYQNSGSAKTFVAGSNAYQNMRAVRIA